MTDLNSLLIGSVSLIIILSIWALNLIVIGKNSNTGGTSLISLRLFWLYVAVVFAMVAIILSLIKVHFEGLSGIEIYIANIILKEFIYSVAFSCTITAFIMGFTSIVESTIFVAIQGCKNKILSDSATNAIRVSKIWFIVLAVIAILILVLSLLAVIFNEWFVIGIIAIVILLILLSISKVTK